MVIYYNPLIGEDVEIEEPEYADQPIQQDSEVSDEAGVDWANAPDQLDNEDSRIAKYIAEANESGVSGSITGKLWDAFGAASKWAKANPEISKMLASGVGTALKQKNDLELTEKRNQWDIDKENRRNAREDDLWKRKNDSITGMQPAGLGLIGKSMYDAHLNYLKNRT